jgi:hypothetical protein
VRKLEATGATAVSSISIRPATDFSALNALTQRLGNARRR